MHLLLVVLLLLVLVGLGGHNQRRGVCVKEGRGKEEGGGGGGGDKGGRKGGKEGGCERVAFVLGFSKQKTKKRLGKPSKNVFERKCMSKNVEKSRKCQKMF